LIVVSPFGEGKKEKIGKEGRKAMEGSVAGDV
jgi:hypothetical protein